MGFPIFRIHGDEGEHIDGGLEHIEFSVSAKVMKTISGIAALHILSEGLSKTVGTSFVSVARGALFICPHKDTVVIFAILKESLFFRKIGNHIAVNMPHLKARLVDSGFIDKDFNLTREALISMLNERFSAIDYEQAKQDVIPFIKDKTNLDIWSTEFFTEITKGLNA